MGKLEHFLKMLLNAILTMIKILGADLCFL